MTKKRYYEDAYLQQTEAAVIQTGTDEKGSYAVLDQTCFYPEGGGQPADTGKIGTAAVTDVQTVGEEIRHYTEELIEKGRYLAEINYQRRYDHMQQHAGQHVLSAVLDDDYGMKTVSFHLGAERVSIDLNVPEIPKTVLAEAEQKANEIIRRHLPIATSWVSEEEAAGMALRKPPAVEGPIRLVKIDGIDLNACGGTHPDNTAEISPLKLLGTEKAKGGTRLYFLCGDRALRHFEKLIGTTDSLVQQLNAPLTELTEAAAGLLKEKAAAEKTIKELQTQLLEMEAATIRPEREDGLIERSFTGRPIKEVQQLAKLTAAAQPLSMLLFVVSDGEEIRFVCAKGEEAEGDVRPVLDGLLKRTDGKGGGNAKFGQGGGLWKGDIEELFGFFRSAAVPNQAKL